MNVLCLSMQHFEEQRDGIGAEYRSALGP